MNLNNLYMTNVHPLSNVIVYDSETGEVVLHIDRVSIAITLEEFGLLVEEFEQASLAMNNILISSVQESNKKDQEIN